MEKYHLLNAVGAGAFGRVWKALNKHSGEVVAVKMLKERFHSSWEECLNLEEIKSLQILKHSNIVSLKKVITHQRKRQQFILCVRIHGMQSSPANENKSQTFLRKRSQVLVFSGFARPALHARERLLPS
ncbi:hypothetical protein Ddye_014191 [Dipteronia dyeriana]|uniref:Protein kinase domain-containing protein n=1 Tax=Dipteronia dyeriana TaxID=168575 RepID=A0AAD9X7Q9_9ROSI|nr:hypothetical protein Ddye_014191 [Dipteronia dyeriana]